MVCMMDIQYNPYIVLIGVYFSLKKMVYTNNSIIPITAIGETDTMTMPPHLDSNNGLQCITDKRPCCAGTQDREGEWYFPNGTKVPIKNHATTFYRNRGNNGTVNLNRVNGTSDVIMPTGEFCCQVHNSLDENVTVCVNIGKRLAE